jgi:YVTN family beta-propeller protein
VGLCAAFVAGGGAILAAQGPGASLVASSGDPVQTPQLLAESEARGPAPAAVPQGPSAALKLRKVRAISGRISPKSVAASGRGLVFAQNMIYNHSVTVYDESGALVKTIPDGVDLSRFGADPRPGLVKGGPVELAFSPDGSKAYVTNYSMYGPGFSHPGTDTCSPARRIDSSFVYRIDVASLTIDQVIAVGAVPKYVATTPDGRYVLVTNWCSYDLSVIDVASGRQRTHVNIGPYPRGIAVASSSRTAYVAVMGGRDIVTVDVASLALGRIRNVGGAPRDLRISPDGRFLYATLNQDGTVAKVDVASGRVVRRISTGQAPRSMAISTDGDSLYVVNYESSSVAKIRTADMTIVQKVQTAEHPIGVTYDSSAGRVWVASYSGVIQVFDEVRG